MRNDIDIVDFFFLFLCIRNQLNSTLLNIDMVLYSVIIITRILRNNNYIWKYINCQLYLGFYYCVCIFNLMIHMFLWVFFFFHYLSFLYIFLLLYFLLFFFSSSLFNFIIVSHNFLLLFVSSVTTPLFTIIIIFYYNYNYDYMVFFLYYLSLSFSSLRLEFHFLLFGLGGWCIYLSSVRIM